MDPALPDALSSTIAALSIELAPFGNAVAMEIVDAALATDPLVLELDGQMRRCALSGQEVVMVAALLDYAGTGAQGGGACFAGQGPEAFLADFMRRLAVQNDAIGRYLEELNAHNGKIKVPPYDDLVQVLARSNLNNKQLAAVLVATGVAVHPGVAPWDDVSHRATSEKKPSCASQILNSKHWTTLSCEQVGWRPVFQWVMDLPDAKAVCVSPAGLLSRAGEATRSQIVSESIPTGEQLRKLRELYEASSAAFGTRQEALAAKIKAKIAACHKNFGELIGANQDWLI